MRTLFFVGVGLLLSTPFAAQDAKVSGKGPRIAVEPAGFDFGQALKNRELAKEFYIRNFGNEDLTIEKVSTSCGCTVATGYSKVVKPGGSTPLQVTLHTQVPGRLQKSVLIRSNDPTRGTYELKVSADVVDADK